MNLRALPGGRLDVRGRVPVHNLEAEEQCLVHAIDSRRKAVAALGLGLKPAHFYHAAHARIWEAIATVAQSPDLESCFGAVFEWLRARGWLESVGGESRLREIAFTTAISGPIREHVETVIRLARIRAVQAEAHLIFAEGYGDVGDAAAWLEAAPLRVARHAQGARAKPPQSFAETLKISWKTLSQSTGARAGYPTGLEAYDAATGGLHPGEVLLVSAKEKAGKSMLVGQWFASLARTEHEVHDENGQPVLGRDGQPTRRRRAALIFALDAAKQTDWAERVAAAHALVDLERFRIGTADQRDRDALVRGIEFANGLEVHVDGEEIGSVGQMGARIRAHRDELAARGVHLVAVAIDYIQLSKGEGQNREQQITNAMRGVVSLAGQADLASIAWVVISQTNSEGELSHCRALAQMCDGWIHLTVDDDKPSESWWSDTAQGGEVVAVYPAELKINRSRRGAMGRRARPIALWVCYRFTFFYGAKNDA